MRYCEKCRVSVRGAGDNCPLCQSRLSGEADAEQYPAPESKKSRLSFAMKIAALATAAACIAAGAVNYIVTPKLYWSLLVLLGAACAWICFAYAVKKRRKLSRNIIVQVILICAFCVMWDIITGYKGWSADYVLPCVLSGAMIAFAVLSRVLKMPASDYIFCLLWDIVFGIVPAALLFSGRLRVVLPSVICICLSIVMCFSIALFQGKEIRLEIQKRFHM